MSRFDQRFSSWIASQASSILRWSVFRDRSCVM
jgi:hypothetical protein